MEELFKAIEQEDHDNVLNECNILLFEPEHKLKGTPIKGDARLLLYYSKTIYFQKKQ